VASLTPSQSPPPSNCTQLLEQVGIQIENYKTNLPQIKDVGLQIYDWLSDDIDKLEKEQKWVGELGSLDHVLTNC
jgi:hypothetical protein